MNQKNRSRIFDKPFRELLILFLLPSLLLSVSFMIIYGLNFYNNKKQLQQNYSSSLSLYSQACETKVTSVLSSAAALCNSQQLMDYLQNKTDFTASGTYYNITSILSQLKNVNEIIDDIYIIDKTENQIVSTYGMYELDDFFNNLYVYDSYNRDYWLTFAFLGRMEYHILSPATVHSSDGDTAVIPIVFRSFSGARFSKFTVVNISLDKLLNSNSSYHLTNNSSLFVLSKLTGDVFGTDNNYKLKNILDTQLYKNMLKPSSCFNYRFGREKVLIVSASFTDNLLGYTYFAAIPYSDIYKIQSPYSIVTIVIYIVFLVLALYFSLLNAQKIANPLYHIATALSKNEKSSHKNILEYINESIESIHRQQTNIAKAMPYAQEKYLINFLNSADLYIDDAAKDIIKESLPFRHDYYASVIFQMFPKQNFFDSFTLNEYNDIFFELNNIIKSMFCEKFDTFFLSSERETLYTIINADENNSIDDIKALVDEINNILQYDNNYLNIYTGIGSFHSGLNGLKISHKEATDSLKSVPFDVPKVALSDSKKLERHLDAKDETKLYNMLISLDIPSAQAFIKQTLQNVRDMQSSRYLHLQILNILLRVLQAKNLMSSDLFDEYIAVLDKSADSMYRYILVIINKLELHKEDTESNKSIHKIIEYINQNFRDTSLSLDNLATIFSMNPNYLSQILKKHLGIGFHEYLSNLRISYTQELLQSTGKSIQSIYEESGFYSRQTFFRSFKTAVGMSPSEYRKAHQKGNGNV